MLFSQMFIPTLRQDPKDADCISHKLSLKAGLLYMYSAGIYAYLPLGFRLLHRIEDIIRKNMNKQGASELFMTALQPLEMWKQTGRDEVLNEVMLKIKDRRGRNLCLGPTHEEAITEIVKRHVVSYKQLPLTLYQIQEKYRDEVRPRFGLVRGCEFIMKDAYSFDIDEKGLDISYDKMFKAYNDIFTECGLDFVITEADSGAMGGNVSHEFMVSADIGEDLLYFCPKCNSFSKEKGSCKDCKKPLKEKRMIEVGHVFKLGTKYSQAQGAVILNDKGKRVPIIMGCYGIGVSRLIPSIIEQNHDDKGIIWPKNVSPFKAMLLLLDKNNQELLNASNDIYQALEQSGIDSLFDDRKEGAGVKFKDAYLLGIPYIVIVGKKYKEDESFEVEIRASGEKKTFKKEELINFLIKEYEC